MVCYKIFSDFIFWCPIIIFAWKLVGRINKSRSFQQSATGMGLIIMGYFHNRFLRDSWKLKHSRFILILIIYVYLKVISHLFTQCIKFSIGISCFYPVSVSSNPKEWRSMAHTLHQVLEQQLNVEKKSGIFQNSWT